MRFTDIVKDSAAIQAIFGVSPIRVYPAEYAVTAGDKITRPYAVWKKSGGAPDNTLSCRPRSERIEIQIDVYADSVKECRTAANAIEYAIELDCYVLRYLSEENEPGTKLYRTTYNTQWFERR